VEQEREKTIVNVNLKRPRRQDLILDRAVPVMPNQDERRCSIERSVESKAAERSRKQNSDLLLSHSLNSKVMDSNQGSFSEMSFSVGILKDIEKIIRREKIGRTRYDDLLIQLQKKREMRFKPKVKIELLKKRK
jgi:hypothetical protein